MVIGSILIGNFTVLCVCSIFTCIMYMLYNVYIILLYEVAFNCFFGNILPVVVSNCLHVLIAVDFTFKTCLDGLEFLG